MVYLLALGGYKNRILGKAGLASKLRASRALLQYNTTEPADIITAVAFIANIVIIVTIITCGVTITYELKRIILTNEAS